VEGRFSVVYFDDGVAALWLCKRKLLDLITFFFFFFFFWGPVGRFKGIALHLQVLGGLLFVDRALYGELEIILYFKFGRHDRGHDMRFRPSWWGNITGFASCCNARALAID
jgi:hypothetical protein